MDRFIHIRSSNFPILPGEKAELVNDGMYGKAVAQYLQGKLKERGYHAPFFCCEDWGWWIELKSAPFTFGVCIYSGPERDGPLDFFCTTGTTGKKMWSWRRFRFVDTTSYATKLHDDLVSIFQADPEIQIFSTSLESPFAATSTLPDSQKENDTSTAPGSSATFIPATSGEDRIP